MNSGFAATGQPPSLGKRGVLQRTLEPGPHWRLYCTIRRLPFVARRWRRQATEVSCWKRRRIAYLTPPLWEGVSLPKATTPRGKRLTAFSVAYGSLRMQFAAHRSGQRGGARPTTLMPHPSEQPAGQPPIAISSINRNLTMGRSPFQPPILSMV